jgi:uncharacterized membrane protein YqjE
MPVAPHRLDENRVPDAASDASLSLSAALQSVYHEVSLLVHDHLRLAALEARRAVRDLVVMITLGIVAALLLITGWLALVAGVVAWAVDHGASWPAALFVAALVSVAAAIGAALWIKHLGSRVMFALTLRWLRPAPTSGHPTPREAGA